MKYNEEEYKNKIKSLYGDKLKVIGRFKGLENPILIEDEYGILSCAKASLLLKFKPTIKIALNKTEYFMNQLREKYPETAKIIQPVSEYKSMKQKILFKTKFGIISIAPDALIHGIVPNIRSAVDRKEYMYKQLKFLYNDKYDFKVLSTDRHIGKCILICPTHGEVEIDNDYIFSGCGCIKCNCNWTKSNCLYIIKLTSEGESFYKLGISYRTKNGAIRRYTDYKKLKYEIEIIKERDFENYSECVQKEFELKQLIKNNLYCPKNWPNKNSTECFTDNLLSSILSKL